MLVYADDPMEVAACNMYQELLGFLIYRSFATQVKDPFLARMLDQFAKDECRHFRFYQDVVARHLQQNPSFRPVVLKVFLKATSPYNQISGGPANVLDHLTMGAFYFRKREFEYFLRENEYLLGTNLRPFWDWYFRGVIEPCTHCGSEVHACSCTHFEDDKPAPIRNPTWWQKVAKREASRGPNADRRDDVEQWAEAVIGRRSIRPANLPGTSGPLQTH